MSITAELTGISNKKVLSLYSENIVSTIAVIMTIWQICVIAVYPIDPLILRCTHLAFVSLMIPQIYKIRKGDTNTGMSILDILIIVAAIAPTIYLYFEYENLVFRVGVDPTNWDIIFGSLTIAVIIEITRRTTGMTLVLLTGCFLLYGLLGEYLPTSLGHSGYSYARIVSFLFGSEGIFSMPLGVSSTFVFLFILFGSFLNISGAGHTFTSLAMALAGWARGGTAKIALIASSLFGMISGSAVANVMMDGVITIPMMMKAGYKPRLASAIEAVASTGGQIMPPVMGAGAFIMAEILGISYNTIIIAAAVPALLFYLALYLMIDFEAIKNQRNGLPREKLPRFKEIIFGEGHLLIPLLILILSLCWGTSPIRAALYAMISIIICGFFRKNTIMTFSKIVQAFRGGAEGILEVAATCACAGIIVGIMALTGLGVRISSLLITFSFGCLPLALVLSMLICFVLGMGLPTTAAYIIAGSTVAPSLIKLGVSPLPAHLFVFYFACLSAITPPVALAAFAASGISKSNVWAVGFTSASIAAAGYLIPYMFVYGNALLLMGDYVEIVQAVITACFGIMGLAGCIQGWFIKPLQYYQRLLLFTASLLLIKPGILTDAAGFAILCIVVISVRLGSFNVNYVPRLENP